jgi:hypothetical protein
MSDTGDYEFDSDPDDILVVTVAVVLMMTKLTVLHRQSHIT